MKTYWKRRFWPHCKPPLWGHCIVLSLLLACCCWMALAAQAQPTVAGDDTSTAEVVIVPAPGGTARWVLTDPPPQPSGGSGVEPGPIGEPTWVELQDFVPGVAPPAIRQSDPVQTDKDGSPRATPVPTINVDGVVNSPATRIPPDTHIAVGPMLGSAGRVIMVTNGDVQIWDKTAPIPTLLAGPSALTALFPPAGFDPVVLYDQHSGLFFIVCLNGTTPATSVINIAVSTSATPTTLTAADWIFLSGPGTQVMPSSGTSTWADYPKIGADASALFVTTNQFSAPPTTFLGSNIRVFDKAALMGGAYGFVDLLADAALIPGVFTIAAAHTYGATDNGGFYLINRVGSTSYRIYNVTGHPAAPVATTATYGWAAGAFPGDTTADQCMVALPDLDTLSSRIQNAVYQNDTAGAGHLYCCLTSDPDGDGQTEAVWQNLATNSFPTAAPTVADSGFINGTGALNWTYMPSINIDSGNDLAICFTQSSPTRCPDVSYAFRASTAPPGTFDAPVVAWSGMFYDSFVTGSPDRWGDYSGCVPDPSQPCFWLANEYAFTSAVGASEWGTRLVSFCKLGACCHGPKACADMTAADCAALGAGWTFRGVGTQCPTQNVGTAQHQGVTVVHWTNPAINCLTMKSLDGGGTPGKPIDWHHLSAKQMDDPPKKGGLGKGPERSNRLENPGHGGLMSANNGGNGGPRQGGEDCASATIITSIPYSDAGTTLGYWDDYDESCPSASTSPDVAYMYVPMADECVDITLCNGSNYDTKLFVYAGACPGTLVACDDDFCGSPGWQSEVFNVLLTAGETYYIIIDGWGGASGDYTLDITPCIPPDPVDCPPEGLIEPEPCGDGFNGGCNTGTCEGDGSPCSPLNQDCADESPCIPDPGAFTPIDCDDTYCGTAWADGGMRDTDWYEINHPGGTLEWCAETEVPVVLYILNTECEDLQFYDAAEAASGTPGCASAVLPAGTYYLFIATGALQGGIYSGYPCSDDNDYVVTVRCFDDCEPGLLIDAWTTDHEENNICHVFGIEPESPAIPGNFFEPGSQPFEGEVCLMGQPLGSTAWGDFETADTIIQRTEDPFDRCELPDPVGRTIDIEIVALSLQSIEPITVQVFGEDTFWDVYTTLSQAPSPPLGQLTATKEHCNGGTYDSVLFVQPRFTFTKVGGPGVPPGTQQVLDTGLEGIPPVQLDQQPHPWALEADPNIPFDSPWCTNFHPGIEDVAPTTDCDCNSNLIKDVCDIESGFSEDCNGNGIPDECDLDADGDSVPDDCDNCPDDPNPDQLDSDGDNDGDACDLCPLVGLIEHDQDGDRVVDELDNCPCVSNKDQADADGDGIGDVCDCPCLGDMTGEGDINALDIQGFVDAYMEGFTPDNVCADIDEDGDIDDDDVGLLVDILLYGVGCSEILEEDDVLGFDDGDLVFDIELELGPPFDETAFGVGSLLLQSAFEDVQWSSQGSGGGIPEFTFSADQPFQITDLGTSTQWQVTGGVDVLDDPNPGIEPDFFVVADMEGPPLGELGDGGAVYQLRPGGIAEAVVNDPAFGSPGSTIPIIRHRVTIATYCIYDLVGWIGIVPPPCPPAGWPGLGGLICVRCDARQLAAGCPGSGWYRVVGRRCFVKLDLLAPNCVICPGPSPRVRFR